MGFTPWTFNRVAVAITVVAAAALCAIGVTEGDAVPVGIGGIGAIAFAASLRPPASKALRAVAFGLQVLALIAMIVTLLALLSIAESGSSRMPVWFWIAVVATLFVASTATVEGYRVYRAG